MDKNVKKYRDNGAIGALLDEYEKAILELQDVIKGISKEKLTTIVDTKTKDPDCVSIQTILTHVVRAGYGYVVEIRKFLGEQLPYSSSVPLDDVAAYSDALQKMFQYNVQLFEDYPTLKLEEYDALKKINVKWGQQYDVDQLLEHAIVHILRHRRQIERFLLKLKHISL